jgi:hypothetical protein
VCGVVCVCVCGVVRYGVCVCRHHMVVSKGN